jgi:hypothetical protein
MDRRAGRVWVVAVVAIVLVLGGTSAWFVLKARQGDDLDALYAKAKAAGFATSKDEVQPRPPGRPEDNGSKLLLAALKEADHKIGVFTPANSVMTAWRKRNLGRSERASFLKNVQPTLDHVRAALAKPYIYFEKDYDEGPNVLFPELASIKNCVKALMISAGAKADAGDLSGAQADIECGIKLEEAIHATPLFIHAFVEISIRPFLEHGIEDVAGKLVSNGKGMAQFARLVSRLPQSVDLVRTMHSEFYIALSLARNLSRMGGISALKQLSSDSASGNYAPPITGTLVRTGLPTDRLSRDQLRPIITQYLAIDSIVKDPATDFDTKIQRLERLDQKLDDAKGVENMLALLVFPGMATFAKNCRRLDGYAAVEKCFMLVMNYRAQHGHFPKSLTEANALVNDPFYDAPLHYSTTRDTCSVWTPGPVTETMDPDTGGQKRVTRETRMGYPPGS